MWHICAFLSPCPPCSSTVYSHVNGVAKPYWHWSDIGVAPPCRDIQLSYVHFICAMPSILWNADVIREGVWVGVSAHLWACGCICVCFQRSGLQMSAPLAVALTRCSALATCCWCMKHCCYRSVHAGHPATVVYSSLSCTLFHTMLVQA